MTTKYSDDFIEEHRNINVGHDWWDSTYDHFSHICEIMGIDLDNNEPSFSGFWSQGDGASWTGTYSAIAKDMAPTYDIAPAKVREHAPEDEELHRIADELCLLARIYHPTYVKVYRRGNYVHSYTMHVDEWEYIDEEIDMDDVDDAIAELIEETLLTQFRALADWLYCDLEKEYDYLKSDEAVIDTLEANEIEEAA